MALTDIIGFICYNNSDLVRDGHIDSITSRVIDADDFNFNKLRKPRKGVSYILKREDEEDPEKITTIIERRRLLPAEKIKIEIQFSKTLKNAVTNPITPGAIPGFAGFAIGNPLSGIGFGGITSGFTDFVYDIIDSEMLINERIKITQEILDTGVIEFNSFPVSIFGIVKEYQEELVNTEAEQIFKETYPQGRVETDSNTSVRVGKVGLNFTDEQLDKIGQHNRGQYQGGPRKRIDGSTDSTGQFGTIGTPYLQIVENQGDSGNPPEQEVVLLEGQKHIFIEIIRDRRKIKFRGDNPDSSGQRHYPFKNREVDDITDHNIKIDTSDLKLDDVIYITFCASTERRVRQAIRHKGIVGQGNRFGVSGWNLEIGSELDIFDYQISNWIVPKGTPDVSALDEEYKISFSEYKDWKDKEQEFDEAILEANSSNDREDLEIQKQNYFNNRFDKLEGWRMSSVITSRLDLLWAADYRGIVLMGNKHPAVVVYEASKIRDQEWFLDYIKSLDFIKKHEDPVTGVIIYDDLKIKIDDVYEKINDMKEAPIDIGNPANELLFDKEKIPYFRDLAQALQTVSVFNNNDGESGVGIPALDILLKNLLDNGSITGLTADSFYESGFRENYLEQLGQAFNNASWNLNDLAYYDLSLSTFFWSKKQPIASWDCKDDYPTKEFNYNCNTFDPGDGPGIWLTSNFIENSLFEWRPPGGYIESYWKMDTPYFCGEFGRNTRIYIERVGGNSLDNFSWIYVDTWPDIPELISMDKSVLKDTAYLAFYDNEYFNSIMYHIFDDSNYKNSLKYLTIDTDKKQVRDFLVNDGTSNSIMNIHDSQKIIGYNNILGDSPSYTKGRLLNNDISYVCENQLSDFWKEVDLLNDFTPSGQSFDIDFTEDIPKINNIPLDWSLKQIVVDFSISDDVEISFSEAYASLYFEDTDQVINNFLLSRSTKVSDLNLTKYQLLIDGQYYNSNTIQLLGDSWKKINVNSMQAVFAESSLIDNLKIDEGQTAIISDALGRVIIFFTDSTTNNISIAITYDEGKKWYIHRSILRLLTNEIATMPVAYKDTNSDFVNLFYVLNDSFLMYTTVNITNLYCEDVWKTYIPPDFYDETSEDDVEDNENSSLYPFTEGGKDIRRQTSYFVAGDFMDSYFIDQINITNNIQAQNHNSNSSQSIRFNYVGDLNELDGAYNGTPYGINRDDNGILRLFYAGEQGLTIKKSTDYQRWEYLAKDLPFHKTYLTDDLIKEKNPLVTNIQLARNYYNETSLYLFYFFRGMLLMREIPTAFLEVRINNSGIIDDSELRAFLSIEEAFYGFRPLFISGQIPEDILNIRIDELKQEALGNNVDSKIAIRFPYDLNNIVKFNSNFELDTSTQVFAYVMDSGLIRVFYKDIFGNLNAAYINGNISVPEIFFTFKGTN